MSDHRWGAGSGTEPSWCGRGSEGRSGNISQRGQFSECNAAIVVAAFRQVKWPEASCE